jgi:hypothetical protein
MPLPSNRLAFNESRSFTPASAVHAVLVASCTLSKSFPSTLSPGKPNAAARVEISFTLIDLSTCTEMALVSQIITKGNLQSEAMLAVHKPSQEAPSQKSRV